MPSARANQKAKPALRWLALFCALSVWVVGLLAASPELHASLHADAGHLDHGCAVTLFSHGIEDGAGSTCLVCAPLFFSAEKSLIQPVTPVADVLHLLPPGRGPPLC